VALASCWNKQPEMNSPSLVAIHGYDPVAYFRQEKPVMGDRELTYTWKGSKWLFSSQENLDSFSLNPEKYAPQYGGYCAYGCSRGKKVATDPNAWTIFNGKLYLNKSLEVQSKWLQDKKHLVELADKNWDDLKDK